MNFFKVQERKKNFSKFKYENNSFKSNKLNPIVLKVTNQTMKFQKVTN